MSQTKRHILYIEDDLRLAKLVTNYLQANGFMVSHYVSGNLAMFDLLSVNFDLVLLDIGLPDEDGYAVFTEIKLNKDIPVIFMTARQSQIDHIKGLEIGADDFLTKPVAPSILLARINVCIKRKEQLINQSVNTLTEDPNQFIFGELKINCHQLQAYYKGVSLDLTTAEFELLVLLASNAGKLITRDDIFDSAIGRQYDGLNRTVDSRVSRLRKKFDDGSDATQKIKTVWGKGYIFIPEAW